MLIGVMTIRWPANSIVVDFSPNILEKNVSIEPVLTAAFLKSSLVITLNPFGIPSSVNPIAGSGMFSDAIC